MNEDGFRKKFRTSKSGGSEKFSHLRITFTLIDRLNSFDWLTDLFLKEQFILCCSRDLSLFRKKRIPSTVQEIARYADHFAEARAT